MREPFDGRPRTDAFGRVLDRLLAEREDIAYELSLYDYSMDAIELACNGGVVGSNILFVKMFTEILELSWDEHGVVAGLRLRGGGQTRG